MTRLSAADSLAHRRQLEYSWSGGQLLHRGRLEHAKATHRKRAGVRQSLRVRRRYPHRPRLGAGFRHPRFEGVTAARCHAPAGQDLPSIRPRKRQRHDGQRRPHHRSNGPCRRRSHPTGRCAPRIQMGRCIERGRQDRGSLSRAGPGDRVAAGAGRDGRGPERRLVPDKRCGGARFARGRAETASGYRGGQRSDQRHARRAVAPDTHHEEALRSLSPGGARLHHVVGSWTGRAPRGGGPDAIG